MLLDPRSNDCVRVPLDVPLGPRSVVFHRAEIIVGAGKTLRVLSLEGRETARIVLGDERLDDVTEIFVCPERRQLAAACGSTLVIVDLDQRAVVQRFEDSERQYRFAAFVPFRPHLVSVSTDRLIHAVVVLDPVSGTRKEVARLEDPNLSSFWLSRAGSFLACGVSAITLLSMPGGQPLSVLPSADVE
jgi:hypothetical protein